ncbi:MAG: CoA transferase subunit A [Candidatus Cloacimonetes bacterium]|jgi:3-oxoacid CoA-transferase A subunit|nr:CoA transferase subunit A [Candidatus Cloacimonadota bacterium]HPM02169.1 CoA transferase subunit A [Candidatus Cloacimonadota bacterium]
MPKIIDAQTAAAMIKPNDRIMFGSFLAVGCAETIIDEMVKLGTKDLHMICIASDYENRGVGKLIANKQIKSAQVSHLGTNKAIQDQYNKGEMIVEMIPQGTLMERIRAKGAGLGGVLTPTGLGTIVQEGKDIIEVDGNPYILEKPIGADWAILKAEKADKMGNLVYNKTARNSNPIMATAATKVIVEVKEIVEIGEINPEDVVTPGIFVHYIVKV